MSSPIASEISASWILVYFCAASASRSSPFCISPSIPPVDSADSFVLCGKCRSVASVKTSGDTSPVSSSDGSYAFAQFLGTPPMLPRDEREPPHFSQSSQPPPVHPIYLRTDFDAWRGKRALPPNRAPRPLYASCYLVNLRIFDLAISSFVSPNVIARIITAETDNRPAGTLRVNLKSPGPPRNKWVTAFGDRLKKA